MGEGSDEMICDCEKCSASSLEKWSSIPAVECVFFRLSCSGGRLGYRKQNPVIFFPYNNTNSFLAYEPLYTSLSSAPLLTEF